MKPTFREYLKENLDSQALRDLSLHGADGGFNGLIYYSELMDIYQACEDEILDCWQDSGYELPELKNEHTLSTLVSKLVWGAAEWIAEDVADEIDAEAEEAENEADDEA